MRKLIGTIALLVACGTSLPAQAQRTQCPYAYLSLVLHGPEAQQGYVSFRVSYQGEERLACAHVSHYLQLVQASNGTGLDPERRFLDRQQPLASGVPLDSLPFQWATNSAEVAKVAKRGEAFFIKQYFNEKGCLRPEQHRNLADIMQYLQRWCIAAYQDHETGYLVIEAKVQHPQ